MNFFELAKKRYSVRKFSNKPVEKEKIDLILKTAQVAPTAVNYQPQQLLIIQSDEAIEKLKSCTADHFNAPMAILVCYDKEISWKRSFDGFENGDIDASSVIAHIIFEATELGLGTTWVGKFDPKLFINAFEIPERLVPVALIPLGYPAEDAKPSPRHFEKYPIKKMISYNDFSNWQPKK